MPPLTKKDIFTTALWVIFCYSIAFVFFAAGAVFVQKNPFEVLSWAHWDSFRYLSIAEKNYPYELCPLAGYGYECANFGWFPGFPYAIRLISRLGWPEYQVGFWLVFASTLTLFSLFALWLRRQDRSESTVLLLIAFFPASIYYYAIFPVTIFILLAFLSLWFASRRRLVLSYFSGMLAAFTYTTGLALAPALAVIGWKVCVDRRWWYRVFQGVALGLAPILGFACVMSVHHHFSGSYTAFFLVQSHFQHRMELPHRAFEEKVIDPIIEWVFPSEAIRQPVWIKNGLGFLLSAENGGGAAIFADRLVPGPWELFEIRGSDRTNLRLYTSNGSLVGINGSGFAYSDVSSIVVPVQVKFTSSAEDTIQLSTGVHNGEEYSLCAEAGSKQVVLCGNPETFLVERGVSSIMGRPKLITAVSSLTVLLFVLAIGIWGIRPALSDPLLLGLIIYGISFLGFGWAHASTISLYRAESLLAPLSLLAVYLPRWIRFIFILVFMVLAFPMAILFFTDILV